MDINSGLIKKNEKRGRPRGLRDRKPQLPARENRCVAIVHGTGRRCKNGAIRGGTVCPNHGGRVKAIRRKANERLQEIRDRAVIQLHRMIRQVEISNNPSQYLKVITAALDRTGLASQSREGSVDVNVNSNYSTTNVTVQGDLFSIDQLPLEVKMLLMYAKDNSISNRLKQAIQEEVRVIDVEGGVRVVNGTVPGTASPALGLPSHREAPYLDMASAPYLDLAPSHEVRSPALAGGAMNEGVGLHDRLDVSANDSDSGSDNDSERESYSGIRLLPSGIITAKTPFERYRSITP